MRTTLSIFPSIAAALWGFGCLIHVSLADDATGPRSLDPRVRIELFAEAPQIVTPTGIDVDDRGRVWAIESHTHFRPDDYEGHSSDRILVMTDSDGNGSADRIVPFADGLTHTMSIAVRPSGAVYVATRGEILLFYDDDGDDRADRKRRLVHLETPGNYPHNGLAGFAFDALDWMYFGFGENLGEDYRLIGSDGTMLEGGGEGGNLYRCRLDGARLQHWATGFWNPHASCFDASGRLFTVDNDPDSRPPCRLLHIIRGGDYGFRFRNGRKGLHPFTAWDGELPGTLPMASGTGEAPSGIVAYEAAGLPPEYRGNLLVTSWGDHRIDRFVLRPQGASFAAHAEPVIVGGENFRPVGIALAPDGSVYCTDWVLRDYNLHGQGRVWRISAVSESPERPIDAASVTPTRSVDELNGLLSRERVAVRRAAARALSETSAGRKRLKAIVADGARSTRVRIEALWAIARTPVERHDFGILRDAPGATRIANTGDAVEVATLALLGTPQFPFDSAASIGKNENGLELDVDVTERLWTGGNRPSQRSRERNLRIALELVRHVPIEQAVGSCDLSDPFLFSAVVDHGRQADIPKDALLRNYRGAAADSSPGRERQRLAWLLIARAKYPQFAGLAELALDDAAAAVRRAAVQWVAEEQLADLQPQVQAIVETDPLTDELFLATLAALEMLDGADPRAIDKAGRPAEFLLGIARDETRLAALRARALRLLPTDVVNREFSLVRRLAESADSGLKLEAVRALQTSSNPAAAKLLADIAMDEEHSPLLRAEAMVGLAQFDQSSPQAEDVQASVLKGLQSREVEIRRESLRVLRGQLAADSAAERAVLELVEEWRFARVPQEVSRRRADELVMVFRESGREIPTVLADATTERPQDIEAWMAELAAGGDASAGRRTFFHPRSAGCFRCHTVGGRGGAIGPDLSVIARTMDRRKLVESVVDPGREIAPQFVAWTIATVNGRVHTGLIIDENRQRIRLGTAEGQIVEVPKKDVEVRTSQQISIMPEKLVERMTVEEFRDLLAFLETLK